MAEIELKEYVGRRDPVTGRVVERPLRFATGAKIRKGLKITMTVNLPGGYFYTLPPGVGSPAPERDSEIRAYVNSLVTPSALAVEGEPEVPAVSEVQEVPVVETEPEAAPTPEKKSKSGDK